MTHFENCRTMGKTYDQKPRDIIIGGTLINIDYTADALYWIDRFEETLTYTATDFDGRYYQIYTNPERQLSTALPVKKTA